MITWQTQFGIDIKYSIWYRHKILLLPNFRSTIHKKSIKSFYVLIEVLVCMQFNECFRF